MTITPFLKHEWEIILNYFSLWKRKMLICVCLRLGVSIFQANVMRNREKRLERVCQSTVVIHPHTSNSVADSHILSGL